MYKITSEQGDGSLLGILAEGWRTHYLKGTLRRPLPFDMSHPQKTAAHQRLQSIAACLAASSSELTVYPGETKMRKLKKRHRSHKVLPSDV